jgi:3-phosphoshikimate 1-carboxyvinyltransferase
MQRIMTPLRQMGARIDAHDNKFPPLEIHGGKLHPIEYELPVASAQVKTCVLFAGLYADGETSLTGPLESRDHTEIALREFGADVTVQRGRIAVKGGAKLAARELVVPSDLSSAAFFIAAALLVPGSHITICGVGLNPTRAALLDFLIGMGAKIKVPRIESINGELIGDIDVRYSELSGGTVEGMLTAGVIDEVPILSVLGAATESGITVRNAEELRIKETDRIATIVENLRRLGVAAEELPDGLIVPGKQNFRAAHFDSFGDHRIAMVFAVAALRGDGESTISGADAASVSFPEFWDTLGRLAGGGSAS